MNGKIKESNEMPDAGESRVIWSDIRSESNEHNINVEWLKKLKEGNKYQKQECLVITKHMVSKQNRKISNWKALGRDGVQGFWIKKLTNLHEQTVFQLNKILNGNKQLPAWLTYGQTVLCQKERTKGNAVIHLLFAINVELLTGIISEHLCRFLEEEKILPEEQKACKRNIRGTKYQVLSDKAVLRDCKRRSENLEMAWIDYRKAMIVGLANALRCLE